VVGLAGDGGFMMTGQELETAVGEQVDLLLIVFRNGLHGTIAMHQARSVGRLAAVRIGAVDVAEFAASLGAAGHTVDGEADLVPVLEEAHRAPGPSVVQVVTDPDVISPASTLSQLLRGAPAG
jgi:acetolactate synthase I/II/III large subunit